MILEVCVDSVESAIAAQEGGASRVELCADLDHGGTTPSVGMVSSVRERITIPMTAMIRPRPGNFCYSEFEIDVMRRDIEKLKQAGADGFALGALTPDSKIDVERIRMLVESARPQYVTFHRAFDECGDRMRALDHLKGLGIDRVLTSSGKRSIDEGISEIAALVKKSDTRIRIMAGGGVTFENVAQIVSRTRVNEIHVLSAVSTELHRRASASSLFDSPLKRVDPSKVRRMVDLLREREEVDGGGKIRENGQRA